MFNSKHYVPILKWKRAELGALKMLEKKRKKYVTPLIQLVMPSVSLYREEGKKRIRKSQEEMFSEIVVKFKENRINKIPEEITQSWGVEPMFLDVSLLHQAENSTKLKIDSMNKIVLAGVKLGTRMIPVIHLDDDQLLRETACSLAKKNNSGLCLRLVCPDFLNLAEMNHKIMHFLKSNKLNEGDVDVIVDIKEIGKNDQVYEKYFDLSQEITNLKKYRTFIFASGAFPEDLSECKIDEENPISRLDWINWKNKVNNNGLTRKPTFSDYTIQHPVYRESVQFFPPTTSIKYSLSNEWLIMKGKKQKFDKYLANAALLVDDDRFYGDSFSDGDRYIAEKAKHFEKYIRNPSIKGTGSTETWLRAGINHHLALVANQVANLS